MVSDDTIRSLVDGYNDLLEYLRRLVLVIPGADTFTPGFLPERIERPVSERPSPPPVAEVVVPMPPSRPEDEGYMLPDDVVGVSSADTRPDYLRLTAAEVADPPTGRQHELIGDNEEDAEENPADQGHISVEIVNAGDNEQAKICFDGPINYGLVLLGDPDFCQPMVVVDFAGVVYGYYGWDPELSQFVWFPAVAGTEDPGLS